MSSHSSDLYEEISFSRGGVGCVAQRHIPACTLLIRECPAFVVEDESWLGVRHTTAHGTYAVLEDPLYSISDEISRTAFKQMVWEPFKARVVSSSVNNVLVLSDCCAERFNREKDPFTITMTNCYNGGLYPKISRFNHSCIPNCEFFISSEDNREASIFTIRDISKGEQLFTSYVNPYTEFKRRSLHLKQTYGFDCICKACVRTEECNEVAETDDSAGDLSEGASRTKAAQILEFLELGFGREVPWNVDESHQSDDANGVAPSKRYYWHQAYRPHGTRDAWLRKKEGEELRGKRGIQFAFERVEIPPSIVKEKALEYIGLCDETVVCRNRDDSHRDHHHHEHHPHDHHYQAEGETAQSSSSPFFGSIVHHHKTHMAGIVALLWAILAAHPSESGKLPCHPNENWTFDLIETDVGSSGNHPRDDSDSESDSETGEESSENHENCTRVVAIAGLPSSSAVENPEVDTPVKNCEESRSENECDMSILDLSMEELKLRLHCQLKILTVDHPSIQQLLYLIDRVQSSVFPRIPLTVKDDCVDPFHDLRYVCEIKELMQN